MHKYNTLNFRGALDTPSAPLMLVSLLRPTWWTFQFVVCPLQKGYMNNVFSCLRPVHQNQSSPGNLICGAYPKFLAICAG